MTLDARPEKVGVLLVHGIGQQTPYVHLHTECRSILAAMSDTARSIDVRQAPNAVPAAAKWSPTDTLVAHLVTEAGAQREIHFHETFWADLGQESTAARQISFWFWGLSMWAMAGREKSGLAGFGSMYIPTPPPETRRSWHLSSADRLLLGIHGGVFALASLSVGILNFVLARFGWKPVLLSNLLTAYLGDVMLYTDARRHQPRGLAAGDSVDAQDLLQPPRAEIRKRMVRSLVAMAEAGYDRWYILAHSQGTVVALNGLMDTEEALAACLPQDEWVKLKSNGSRLVSTSGPTVTKPTLPRRPSWLAPTERIDRKALFEGLRGLITYGSPLAKFHAMWPALVPVNRHARVFNDNFEWINVWDPTDPVAGPLRPFMVGPQVDGAGMVIFQNGAPLRAKGDDSPGVCRVKKSFVYSASPVWLLSHIAYLSYRRLPGLPRSGRPRAFLVNQIAAWITGPSAKDFDATPIELSPAKANLRTGYRLAWTLAITLTLWMVGTAVLYWGVDSLLAQIDLCGWLNRKLSSPQFLAWSTVLVGSTAILSYLLLPWFGRKIRELGSALSPLIIIALVGGVSIYGKFFPYKCPDNVLLDTANLASWGHSGLLTCQSLGTGPTFGMMALGTLALAVDIVLSLGLIRRGVRWVTGSGE